MNIIVYMVERIWKTIGFGGDIPEDLVKDFDSAVETAGMKKKRAVAAAIFAFVKASGEQRRRWWDEAFDKYATAPDAMESLRGDDDQDRGSGGGLGKKAG